MPRKTTLEQRIDRYIRSFGLDPSVVLEMTRTMLEEYKEERNSDNPLFSQPPPMTKEQIIKNKQELRREFLKLMKKASKKHRETQKTFVVKAVRAPWLSSPLRKPPRTSPPFSMANGGGSSFVSRKT